MNAMLKSDSNHVNIDLKSCFNFMIKPCVLCVLGCLEVSRVFTVTDLFEYIVDARQQHKAFSSFF